MTDMTGRLMTEQEITANVARGVRWLDAKVPDWLSRVRTDGLVMSSAYCCTLGQVFADRVATDDELNDTGYDYALDHFDWSEADAAVFGFAPPLDCDLNLDNWDALQAEWVRVITERQAVSA